MDTIREKKPWKFQKPYHGQGMVEFALAFPIFLLLVLGIFEFGRLLITYASVYAAAREGARYGSAVENLCDNGQIVAQAERVGFLAGGLNITTSYEVFDTSLKLIGSSCANTKAGDRVIVTASAPFSFITGFIPGTGGGPIILTSTAKRTIIKQVFLEWTLEPASTSSTGVTLTPEPEASHTPAPTPTGTTDPGASATPEPPVCSGNWKWGETLTTYYVDVEFSNPTKSVMTLSQATIAWNSGDGHILKSIEVINPKGDTLRGGAYETANSPVTWVPDPPLGIPPNEKWIVRFVFQKPNTIVTDISLNFTAPNGSTCYITDPDQ